VVQERWRRPELFGQVSWLTREMVAYAHVGGRRDQQERGPAVVPAGALYWR